MNENSEHYLNIVEHTIAPLPDQYHLAFWDKEWIAPTLKTLLFEQPEDNETLNTFLMVDATLRKKVTKFFDLDQLDLPTKCLFTGEAAEELKEAAPYLVDMTLPEGAWDDKGKVPDFHKDFFTNHWDKGTGVIIRSTASMDELHHHLRKFIKQKREDTHSWVFLRYWDPRVALPYFSSITHWSERISAWFMRANRCIISEVLIGSESQLYQLTPNTTLLQTITASPSYQLSIHEIDALYNYKRTQSAQKIALSLEKMANHWFGAFGSDHIAIIRFVEETKKSAHSQGYTSEKGISALCVGGVFLGLHFGQDLRIDASVRELLISTHISEPEKLDTLKELMQQWNDTILSAPSLARSLSQIIRYIESDHMSIHLQDNALYPQNENQQRHFNSEALRGFQCDDRYKKQQVIVLLALLLGMHWVTNPLYSTLVKTVAATHWQQQTIDYLRHIQRTLGKVV